MPNKTEKTTSDSNDTVKTEEPKRWLCKICNKYLKTRNLLRDHRLEHHGTKAQPQETTGPDKKKNLATPKKVEHQKLPGARVSTRLQLKKEEKGEMKKLPSKKETLSEDDETSNIKTEFRCPVCNKTFPVFFTASKHIEKKHKAANDEKTELLALEPIRIDKCTLCSETIEDDYHDCTQDENSDLSYKCLGCFKKFHSLPEFSEHISVKHANDADLMTFRSVYDFRTWKVNTEAQINLRYSVFDKSTKEQYHHCNFVCPKNQKNITFLCPSVIITKDVSKKLHVQYFKNHYGHEPPKYELRDEYKKNLVSEDYFHSIKDIQNTYQKFKTIMQSIINDASFTNLDNLKTLIAMATAMQEYLNDDKKETSNLSKNNMTDNEISEELEKRVLRNKRRAVTPDKGGKKFKTKSKTDDVFDALLSNTPKSPTFNDTYKQFIDSSSPKQPRKINKDVIKTKIQFIPNPRKVIVKDEPEKKRPNILRSNKNNSKNSDVQYEVREQENDCNILVLKI